ncbi:MAG: hypothetical protein DRN11_01685 [Thermoplasmata archaeon]|nr:MAG: hypothetical protein DRN11_01685 [Thermoplasmata archaeon]
MPKEFVLPEFSLKHEEKKKLEEEYFGGYEEYLKEKSWEKRSKESIEEIEKAIDEGLERKVKEKVAKKEEEKIKKEIIYSSKKGFIVKVSYKEGEEEKISYYLVTKIEDIEEALDRISTYKPIIEEGEEKLLF